MRYSLLFSFSLLLIAPFFTLADEKEDLRKAMAMQDDFKKQMMAKFDLNGDGKIDDAEKAKGVEEMQKQLQGGIPEDMKKKFDANGNGQLDPQEMVAMRAFMQQMAQRGGGGPQFGAGGFGGAGGSGGFGFGGGVPAEFPPEVVKKFDKNKDGKLDDKEQKAAMEAMQGVKKSRADKVKDKLDADGDGKVTKEERAAYAEQRKAEQEEKKEEKKAKLKKPSDE